METAEMWSEASFVATCDCCSILFFFKQVIPLCNNCAICDTYVCTYKTERIS